MVRLGGFHANGQSYSAGAAAAGQHAVTVRANDMLHISCQATHLYYLLDDTSRHI